MYAQLGNIVFEGLKGFDSWSNGGEDAIYAEHELINGKPRLQKTGDDLKQLSLTVRFNANFCNPTTELEALKKAKSDGEIMPLLMGDGTYVSDFVITSTQHTIEESLSDGTPIRISVFLQILEFVPFSKLELEQQSARKKAFAVGDKKPITTRPPQKPSSEFVAAAELMRGVNQAKEAAELAQKAQQIQDPETLANRITKACERANSSFDKAKDKIQNLQQQYNEYTGMIAAINNAKNKVTAIANQMPPGNLFGLNAATLDLQSGIRGLQSASTLLTNNVIIRK